jgi:hypothetical protein
LTDHTADAAKKRSLTSRSVPGSALSFVPTSTAPGGPATAAVNLSSKFDYLAPDGVVMAFRIKKIGFLNPFTALSFAAGLNTLWVTIDPSGKFVYTADHRSFSGGITLGRYL